MPVTWTPVADRVFVAALEPHRVNVGLIVGASAMGTVFAFGVGADDFSRASVTAIASGMRLTFLLAGALTVAAIWIAFGYRALSERSDSEGDRHGGVAG